uniref:hypothetical protein n=1 Tax=Kordia jejudonensis TaxID=1348245 RepID=UPI0012E0496B
MKNTYIITLMAYGLIPNYSYANTLERIEVQQTMETLLQKQQAFETRMYIIIGCIALLIFLFGLLCFLNKRGDKRLEKILKLLEKHRQTTEETPKKDEVQLAIDTEIVNTILLEL